MQCLITGISGFAGSHLADYLLSLGHTVHGTIRQRSRRENIGHLEGKVTLHECDLRDLSSVETLFTKIHPDHIYHLAAQSFVPTSWNSPAETMTTNVIGQSNLFEAVLRAGLRPKIQIACSSEEYGMVMPDETPITEENPLRPLSPYGVSKVAQDMMGYQYFKSHGMRIVRTRAFNHTAPRRGVCFVTSNFCKQVAMIEAGKQEPVISVGNLTAVRDFTDARDTVRAYHLLLEHGVLGEVYNIASGVGTTIADMLDLILSFSDRKIEIRRDASRMRPSDVPTLIGDCNRLRAATGWEPTISFEQTMRDLLEYWRGRI
jgi:GDP-4-dehydro-6-deoxy-D-mannose reductase